MKRCLCCGWEGPEENPTCPMCGEASWSVSVRAPEPAPSPTAHVSGDDDSDGDSATERKTPRRKRGRKS